MASLSQSINKISEIDRKISQINNKFRGNMRYVMASLSLSIDKVSGIDKKSCKSIKKNSKINL